MKTALLIFCLLIASRNSMAQNYVLNGEQVIFSFTTVNNKQMVLAKDTANRYLVYRFGTKDKIDFTFPDKIGNPDEAKQSRNKFKYSFYIRGGEKQNEGLDLNYVYFSNGKFKYVIYQTYSANESESRCGIKIIDLATKKTIDIKGKIESIRRDLKDLRDSSLLEIGDELFD